MSELPENWEWSTIGEIGKVASGGTPSTKQPSYYDGDIPWITPKDLSGYDEKFISRGGRSITQDGLDNSSAKILPKGTVLFSSRAPIGYCAISTNEIATNQGFKNLIPAEGISADYVYHYLKGSKQLAEKHASGTTFLELSAKAFSKLPIPVAPLPEQRRIVARIEELFSRLDAGVAALRHAKAQLQRYRQSVLAAAVTGQLTATDPAKWSDESLNEVCESIADGDHQAPPKVSEGIPFLTIGNISSGFLDFSATRFVPEDYYSGIKPHRVPTPNDVLYSVVGATIGIPVLVNTDRPFCFQRHIALLRPSDRVLPKYLHLFMASPQTFRNAWKGTTGSAQPTLPLKALRAIPIALPPVAEQHQIVAEVEARTTAIDHLEAELDRQITRSNRLRQSTLQSAFSGTF